MWETSFFCPSSLCVCTLTQSSVVSLVSRFGSGLRGCGQCLRASRRKRSRNEKVLLTPAAKTALKPLCLTLFPLPHHPFLRFVPYYCFSFQTLSLTLASVTPKPLPLILIKLRASKHVGLMAFHSIYSEPVASYYFNNTI